MRKVCCKGEGVTALISLCCFWWVYWERGGCVRRVFAASLEGSTREGVLEGEGVKALISLCCFWWVCLERGGCVRMAW